DLNGRAAGTGYLPNMRLSFFDDREVDPLAVSREARKTPVGNVCREDGRLAADGWHDKDVGAIPSIAVKREEFSIREPSGKAGQASHRGDLDRFRTIDTGNPHFLFAQTVRHERQLLAVRGDARGEVRPRRSDGNRLRRRRWSTGSRCLEPPDIQIAHT